MSPFTILGYCGLVLAVILAISFLSAIDDSLKSMARDSAERADRDRKLYADIAAMTETGDER